MTDRMAIVVPAFNEETRLDLAAFASFLDAEQSAILCFVDDGSHDGTASRVAELAGQRPGKIILVRHSHNRGKAEAIRTGIHRVLTEGAAFVGYTDADLAAPLQEASRLRNELVAHPEIDVVLGSRVRLLGRSIVRSPLRHIVGRVFATAASLVLRLPVYDTQCGLKLFRSTPEVAAAFAEPFLTRWLFDVELLARLSASGPAEVAMREIPLECWYARDGSRVRFRDFLLAPLELWRIRRHYGSQL